MRTAEARSARAARPRRGRLPAPFTAEEFGRVHRLRTLSLVITVVGLVLAIAGTAGGLGATWTLVGAMLLIAGLVKVVTVAIWRGTVGLGPVKGEERTSR
jgi:fatty acid desaturase